VVSATTITHQFLFIFSDLVVMTSCLRMINPIAHMSVIKDQIVYTPLELTQLGTWPLKS
jgi:hypothetical protein